MHLIKSIAITQMEIIKPIMQLNQLIKLHRLKLTLLSQRKPTRLKAPLKVPIAIKRLSKLPMLHQLAQIRQQLLRAQSQKRASQLNQLL
jgi:hypothetical protein